MTTYSDWIIIPKKDRKCDLPPDAKVQVMWRNEDAEYAEMNNAIESVSKWTDIGGWFTAIFAYRVVQEPVDVDVTYFCWVTFSSTYSPSMRPYAPGEYGWTKGTATQTTRDGKPYRFEWQASE